MTIDGINFSDDPYDNPVKVGNSYCLVETTNASQITCRVMETGAFEATSTEVIVFLRTSEEAQTDVVTAFEYATPLETLTGLTNAFDDATNSQVFTATGTGFDADD